MKKLLLVLLFIGCDQVPTSYCELELTDSIRACRDFDFVKAKLEIVGCSHWAGKYSSQIRTLLDERKKTCPKQNETNP